MKQKQISAQIHMNNLTHLVNDVDHHSSPFFQGANLQELHGRRVKPRRGTNTFTSDCGHPTKNGKRPRLCFRKLPLVLAHSSQEDTCQKHVCNSLANYWQSLASNLRGQKKQRTSSANFIIQYHLWPLVRMAMHRYIHRV